MCWLPKINSNKNMKKAFLSFSPKDSVTVMRLLPELSSEGIEFDFCEIPAALDAESPEGTSLKEKIGQKIVGSSVTVCLIGEDTHSSPWVNIGLTKSRNKGNRILAMALKGVKVALLPQVIKEENVTFYPWNPKKLSRLL